MSGDPRPPQRAWLRTLVLLAGGAAGGVLLTLLHVPAGAIVGAVIGSAAVNGTVPGRPLARPVRMSGLVVLGCIAGARLTPDSIRQLLLLVGPLVVGALLLLVLDVLLARLLSRRYGVDPVTALFACAPGGVSEVVVVAEQAGAQVDVVVAIHLVRVLFVVLVALPALVLLLGPAG